MVDFYLVEKEMNRMRVEFKRESLQERDIICHHFFVREVEFVQDYIVDVVIGKEKIYEREKKLVNR